jgi:hypothetical protein
VKILRGRDDARDDVVGALSWKLNDHAELARLTTILNVGGCSEVAERH